MVITLKNLLGKISENADDKFEAHSSQIICLKNEVEFNK